MCVFESVTPPGEGPPFHVHEAIDELIYVLEGTLRVRLGDQVEEAISGAFIFIPRGQPHTWQSSGNTAARFLVVVAPAGLERLFDGAAASTGTRERRDLFTSFGGEDLTVLGPPLAESHPV
jgi:quercetin dioxygenase-like cupin family protein